MNPRLALLTILPLVAAAPSFSSAADQPAFPDRQMMQQLAEAQRLARQAGDDMIRALDALGRAVPQYGMPYMDPAGNIIIPRVSRPPAGTPVPDPSPTPL